MHLACRQFHPRQNINTAYQNQIKTQLINGKDGLVSFQKVAIIKKLTGTLGK